MTLRQIDQSSLGIYDWDLSRDLHEYIREHYSQNLDRFRSWEVNQLDAQSAQRGGNEFRETSSTLTKANMRIPMSTFYSESWKLSI